MMNVLSLVLFWWVYSVGRLACARHVLACLLGMQLRRVPVLQPIKLRAPSAMIHRSRAKPAWVQREVLRLAALMPDASCRDLRDVFNRMHAKRHAMTVGKTWVNGTVRKHRHEVVLLRRDLKHRLPRALPRNQTWGFDLTGKQDEAGVMHSILGIVDHGTRRALALDALQNKNAWTLLGHLFIAIGRFGKPRAVRTDNESMFTSALWKAVLSLANIRHQLTVPGCPWMNGRVERFFGTLKEKLDRIEVASKEALQRCLGDFGVWYNHVRPHRHLLGATPFEAWEGIDPYGRAPKEALLFTAWAGLLTGFYLRR
jgi:putative transposase